MDFKYSDVGAYDDGYIDVCFFNGGIRNSESLEIAKLLRQKAKTLVAFGACSYMGGIPSLANLYSKEKIFERSYKTTESTDNPKGIYPTENTKVPEGDLHLPKFYNKVYQLSDTVDVDYFVPGCPPTAPQVWNCIEAIAKGALPEKGSVIGAGKRAVCDECPFEKAVKCKIERFKRVHEAAPDLTPKAELNNKPQCLLEQGFVCMGSATRDGCGALCLKANMPCRGCYGPNDNVYDQGAKLVSSIGSLIDTQGSDERARTIIDQIPDPAGTFYRFGMSHSILKRAKI